MEHEDRQHEKPDEDRAEIAAEQQRCRKPRDGANRCRKGKGKPPVQRNLPAGQPSQQRGERCQGDVEDAERYLE